MGLSKASFMQLRETENGFFLGSSPVTVFRTPQAEPIQKKRVIGYEYGIILIHFQRLAFFETSEEAFSHLERVKSSYALEDPRRKMGLIRPVFEVVESEEN